MERHLRRRQHGKRGRTAEDGSVPGASNKIIMKLSSLQEICLIDSIANLT